MHTRPRKQYHIGAIRKYLAPSGYIYFFQSRERALSSPAIRVISSSSTTSWKYRHKERQKANPFVLFFFIERERETSATPPIISLMHCSLLSFTLFQIPLSLGPICPSISFVYERYYSLLWVRGRDPSSSGVKYSWFFLLLLYIPTESSIIRVVSHPYTHPKKKNCI